MLRNHALLFFIALISSFIIVSPQTASNLCLAGQYLPAGSNSTCLQCPSGKSSTFGATICLDNPNGATCMPGEGLYYSPTGISCRSCPRNTFCANGACATLDNSDQSVGCNLCPPGTASLASGAVMCTLTHPPTSQPPRPCPAGSGMVQGIATGCYPCGPNSVNDGTSNVCRSCSTLQPSTTSRPIFGSYRPNNDGSRCVIYCYAGYMKNETTGLCQECPQGMASSAGYSTCAPNIPTCGKGQGTVYTNVISCRPCPPKSFCSNGQCLSTTNNDPLLGCNACGSGESAVISGASSCTRSRATLCPPGTGQQPLIKYGCYNCTSNTYNDGTNARCMSCPADYVPNTLRTGCVIRTCPAGWARRQNASSSSSSMSGSSSPAPRRGVNSSTISVCSKCPPGFMSAPSSVHTPCSQVNMICGPGRGISVPLGTSLQSLTPSLNQIATCSSCARNSYCDTGGCGTSSILISQGREMDSDPYTCTPCPHNTFASMTGAVACTGIGGRDLCPPGTGLGARGSLGCYNCTGDTINPGNGSTCLPCPRNLIANPQKSQCISRPCPAGTFSPSGLESAGCRRCAPGTASTVGARVCTAVGVTCGPGKYVLLISRSPLRYGCDSCPVETYCPSGQCLSPYVGSGFSSSGSSTSNSGGSSGSSGSSGSGGSGGSVPKSPTSKSTTLPANYNGGCMPCPQDSRAGIDGAIACTRTRTDICPPGSGQKRQLYMGCYNCTSLTVNDGKNAFCSKCPVRTVPNPTFTTCRPACPAGTGYLSSPNDDFSSSDPCVPCPEGTFNGGTTLKCQECGLRQWSKSGATVCSPCPYPYISLWIKNEFESCINYPSSINMGFSLNQILLLVAIVTLIYLILHALIFVDWEMKLLPPAERQLRLAAKDLEEKQRLEMQKELEERNASHNKKRMSLSKVELQKANQHDTAHSWDLLKMAGLISLTSIPFFDSISNFAFAFGSNLFTIELLYFTMLLELVQFTFFFTYLYEVGATPKLPFPIPTFAYFEVYDSIFKMMITFLISIPWLIINLPFWFPLILFGAILWITKLFFVGRIAFMWLFFWTGKIDHPRIPEFFDMKVFNKEIYTKTLVVSVPMLVIKAVNNEQLNNWTVLNIASTFISVVSLFDACYRLVYYKILKKINMEDVPVSVIVCNIDFLVIDPNDPKVNARLTSSQESLHPSHVKYPHGGGGGAGQNFDGSTKSPMTPGSGRRSMTSHDVSDSTDVEYHHAHNTNPTSSSSSSRLSSRLQNMSPSSGRASEGTVTWTSSPLNDSNANNHKSPSSRLVTRQSLSKQRLRGSISGIGGGGGGGDEDANEKISTIIQEVTTQMIQLKSKIDEVVLDLDDKKQEFEIDD